MKRTSSLLLSSVLLFGCPGPAEEADGGIDAAVDAPQIIARDAPRSDTPVLPVDAAVPPTDSPVACGALGAACCEGELCADGVCTMGLCEVDGCGSVNGPCCVAGTPCRGSLTCAAGICDNPTCGAPGQSCCGDDCDDTGDRYQCLSGSCFDCGEVGEACCGAGAPACFGDLSCNGGTCAAPVCGMPGMPCCTSGEDCTGALECVRGEINLCVDTSACGNLDEPCCAVGSGCVGTAPPGLECRFGMCAACGAAGQPCCSTGPGVVDRCATGLTCGGGGICG